MRTFELPLLVYCSARDPESQKVLVRKFTSLQSEVRNHVAHALRSMDVDDSVITEVHDGLAGSNYEEGYRFDPGLSDASDRVVVYVSLFHPVFEQALARESKHPTPSFQELFHPVAHDGDEQAQSLYDEKEELTWCTPV